MPWLTWSIFIPGPPGPAKRRRTKRVADLSEDPGWKRYRQAEAETLAIGLWPEHEEMLRGAFRWLDCNERMWGMDRRPIDRVDYARDLVGHTRRSGSAPRPDRGTMPASADGGTAHGEQEGAAQG